MTDCKKRKGTTLVSYFDKKAANHKPRTGPMDAHVVRPTPRDSSCESDRDKPSDAASDIAPSEATTVVATTATDTGTGTDAPSQPAMAAAATPVAPYVPAAVEEHEADDSEVVDLYTSPLARLAPEHPSPLCFSATLEHVRPAALTPAEAKDLLSPRLVEAARPKLSSAQLHSVALAMKAFQNGRAFLLGDGTGVGKGRQSMGVVLSWFYKTGARRALIVSANNLLSADVYRDFKDCRVRKAFPNEKIEFVDASEKLPKELPECAIIFTTYSQIRAKGHEAYAAMLAPPKPAQSAQSAESAAGLLVLDEVHRGGDKKSQTYQQVEALLTKAHASPLLAMSATFASHIEGLRMLAPRLGLVGDAASGAVFRSFDALKNQLGKHKETGLEMVTAHLSQQGLFLARAISYHGTESEHLDCTMSAAHEALYAACAQLFADLRATTLFDGGPAKAYYVGAAVRFFKALTLRCKLPSVVTRIREELAEGRQVVVSVLGTGEASLNRSDIDDVEESGGVSALREDVLGLIAYALDKCNPSDAQKKVLQAATARVGALDLGRCSVLDLMKHELQDVGVSELTGRHGELVYDAADDAWIPRRLDRDLVDARACYQSGQNKVAIISAASATGISLHDLGDGTGVSRPRTMVLFELPWAAAGALQLLGRVHRAGQLSAPRFLTTSVSAAEKRFSAAVAQRLRQLGALTSGDQRDTGGSDVQLDGAELLSAAGGRATRLLAAERKLWGNLETGKHLLNHALTLAPAASAELVDALFSETAKQLQLDVARGRAPAPRSLLIEDGTNTRLADTYSRANVTIETWELDRRLTHDAILAKKEEILAAGHSAVEFAHSQLSDFHGLCLAHHREGIAAVRCHFVDGRVASIQPDRLIAVSDTIVEERWGATYNNTKFSTLEIATIPCFDALARLHRPPKVFRMQRLDGTRGMGIFLESYQAKSLREALETMPPVAPVSAPVSAPPAPVPPLSLDTSLYDSDYDEAMPTRSANNDPVMETEDEEDDEEDDETDEGEDDETDDRSGSGTSESESESDD